MFKHVTHKSNSEYWHSFVDVTGSTKLEVSQVEVPQFTRSWLLPNPRDNDFEDDSEASEACDSDDSCEVIYDGDTRHPGLEETWVSIHFNFVCYN